MKTNCKHVFSSRNSFIKYYLHYCKNKTIKSNVLKLTKISSLLLFSYCFCICGYTCVNVSVKVSDWHCLCLAVYIEAGSLTWTQILLTQLVSLASQLVLGFTHLHPGLPQHKITGRLSHTFGIYVGSGNPNSDSHVFSVSTFSTEPSSEF